MKSRAGRTPAVIVRHRVSLLASPMTSSKRPVRRDVSADLGALWNTARLRGHDGGLGRVILNATCDPFRAHGFIALGTYALRRKHLKLLPPDQLRQRPHRGTPDQRAFVIEQAFCSYGQGSVTGVADRDQHIAD